MKFPEINSFKIKSVDMINNPLVGVDEKNLKYIIVVDNSPSIRSLIELVLTSLEYEVIQAEAARDGLNKIENIRVRAIISQCA